MSSSSSPWLQLVNNPDESNIAAGGDCLQCLLNQEPPPEFNLPPPPLPGLDFCGGNGKDLGIGYHGKNDMELLYSTCTQKFPIVDNIGFNSGGIDDNNGNEPISTSTANSTTADNYNLIIISCLIGIICLLLTVLIVGWVKCR